MVNTPPSYAPGHNLWWVRLLFGVVLAVLGIALLFSPGAAAVTLAWLVGFGLIIHGIDDILSTTPPRWLGILAGLVSLAGGVVSLVWPDVTLWALAVVTGISFIVVGLVRLATGLAARNDPGWGWLVAGGVLSVLAGGLALAWPGTTVLVLALLLGFRTLVIGVVEIALALDSHRQPALA